MKICKMQMRSNVVLFTKMHLKNASQNDSLSLQIKVYFAINDFVETNHNKTLTNLDLPKTQNLNKTYKHTPTNDKNTLQEKQKQNLTNKPKWKKKSCFESAKVAIVLVSIML